jgi:hypothetical protein
MVEPDWAATEMLQAIGTLPVIVTVPVVAAKIGLENKKTARNIKGRKEEIFSILLG